MAETIIHPSTFRNRIAIKTPIVLLDAGGGIGTTGYETQYTLFAYIEDLSAARLTYYGMDLLNSGWLIRFRYSPNRYTVDTGTVIGYGDKSLIIKSIRLVTQSYRRFYELICIESATT